MSTTTERAARTARGQSQARGRGYPVTSEMDYAADDMEFMQAIQRWKNKTGRQFPTWGEVLLVLKDLGYARAQAARPYPYVL